MSEPVITTPVEPVAPTPTPDTPVDAQPVQPVEPGTTETPVNTEQAGAEPTGAEKRISQLVAKQREAEREAAYWRGVAEAGKTQPQQQAQAQVDTPPVAPKIDNFDTYDEFESAKETYLVSKAKYELTKEFEQRLSQNAQQSNTVRLQQTFQERINKAAETDPEILDVMHDRSLPVSEAMASIIQESDVSPQLLRFLSNNRGEAQRIAMLPPINAAREMGKIEAKIINTPAPTPPKQVSQAPTPIQPVSPSTGALTDEDALPIDEWVARRNKVQYGR